MGFNVSKAVEKISTIANSKVSKLQIGNFTKKMASFDASAKMGSKIESELDKMGALNKGLVNETSSLTSTRKIIDSMQQGKDVIPVSTTLYTTPSGTEALKATLYLKKCKIGTTPATLKALATESIQQGATVDEALNGAKAVIAAVGEPSGKMAVFSADVFKREGLTEFEKQLNKNEIDLNKFARKMDLRLRYGDKLEAKHKAEQIAKNLKELNERLS